MNRHLQIIGRRRMLTSGLALCGAFLAGCSAPTTAGAPPPAPGEPPRVTVSLVADEAGVRPGQPFKIEAILAANTPLRGVQLGLRYDPSQMTIESIEEGPFFKEWAQKDSGSTIVLPSLHADNESGRVPTFGIAIMGGSNRLSGPSGRGIICVFNAMARPQASGALSVLLENVKAADAVASNPPTTVSNGHFPLVSG